MPPGILIFEDPPSHTVHRSLLSRVFTPKRVVELEPKIREFCARRASTRSSGRGGFDLIAELGAQMPMRMIGMLSASPSGPGARSATRSTRTCAPRRASR